VARRYSPDRLPSHEAGIRARLQEKLSQRHGVFSATLSLDALTSGAALAEAVAFASAGAVSIALEESEPAWTGGEADGGAAWEDRAEDGEVAAETLLSIRRRLLSMGWIERDLAFFEAPGVDLPYARALRRREPVLGLGPGAISFCEPVRRWNPSAPASYLERIAEGRDPVEAVERLDRAATRLERIWQALRTTRGLSCSGLAGDFGTHRGPSHAGTCLARWDALGYLAPRALHARRIVLSPEGRLVADELAVELSLALDADGFDRIPNVTPW
jgi:hypothetical protein